MLRTLPHAALRSSTATPNGVQPVSPVVVGGREYHCESCLAAVRRRWKQTAHERNNGRRQIIDAAGVRDHLVLLASTGMSWREVELRCGVSRVTLLRIVRGDLLHVHRDTAAAVLGVAPAPITEQAVGLVPSIGTRRRLQALMVVGWSQARLAELLDSTPSQVHRLLVEDRPCTASTRSKVAGLYDQLWATTPPLVTAGDRRSVSRARRYAAEHGWQPAAAWDDDEIDDAAARPHIPRCGRRDLFVAEVSWLVEVGESLEVAAARLGVQPSSIYRTLYRYDRLDLWALSTARQPAA